MCTGWSVATCVAHPESHDRQPDAWVQQLVLLSNYHKGLAQINEAMSSKQFLFLPSGFYVWVSFHANLSVYSSRGPVLIWDLVHEPRKQLFRLTKHLRFTTFQGCIPTRSPTTASSLPMKKGTSGNELCAFCFGCSRPEVPDMPGLELRYTALGTRLPLILRPAKHPTSSVWVQPSVPAKRAGSGSEHCNCWHLALTEGLVLMPCTVQWFCSSVESRKLHAHWSSTVQSGKFKDGYAKVECSCKSCEFQCCHQCSREGLAAWPWFVSIHQGIFWFEDVPKAGSAMASCASASVDDDSKAGTAFGFSHRKADFLKQNE